MTGTVVVRGRRDADAQPDRRSHGDADPVDTPGATADRRRRPDDPGAHGQRADADRP